MKNLFFFISIIFLLNSCSNSTTVENVRGLYFNTYEKEALHYVLLKDSTYIHYYRGDLGELWHEDKLTIAESKNGVNLNFFNWTVYGKVQIKYSKPYLKVGIKQSSVKNGEMMMDVDIPHEMNFHKVNDTLIEEMPVK